MILLMMICGLSLLGVKKFLVSSLFQLSALQDGKIVQITTSIIQANIALKLFEQRFVI